MNSKLIAIIAVVAMCGAALVGVGYAYKAEITSDTNTITSDTVYIGATFKADAKFDVTDFKPIYNSVTDKDNNVTYNFDENGSNDGLLTTEKWTEGTDDKAGKYIRTKTLSIVLDVDVSNVQMPDSGDASFVVNTAATTTPTLGSNLSMSIEPVNFTVSSTEKEAGEKEVTVSVVLTMEVDGTINSPSKPPEDVPVQSFALKFTIEPA